METMATIDLDTEKGIKLIVDRYGAGEAQLIWKGSYTFEAAKMPTQVLFSILSEEHLKKIADAGVSIEGAR